ncbi:MAG: hypothetical protein FWD42_07110, partial [Solirubrobacterales bacterium]|nr:hypothetical protein [Solirubrobacterales bacterium]
LAGAPVDVEPPERRRRRRAGLADEEPGAQISREEFDEMVRDLDIDQAPAQQAPARGGRVAQRVSTPPRTATPSPAPRERATRGQRTRQPQPAAPEPSSAKPAPPDRAEPRSDREPGGDGRPGGDGGPGSGGEPRGGEHLEPAADLTPEDLVLKEKPTGRSKARRSRNRRHGRAR